MPACRRCLAAIAALVLSLWLTTSIDAADFSGSYRSAEVSLQLEKTVDGYTGTLLVRGTSYPVKAKGGADGALEGSFPVGAKVFDFRATLNGDAMSLKSGASSYELHREAGAARPAPPATQHAPAAPPSTQSSLGPPNDPRILQALRDLGPAKNDPARQWLLLVYLAGDNDLEPAGLFNMQQMEAGLPDAGVDVLVLFDRRPEKKPTAKPPLPRLYHVSKDRNPKTIDSEVLREFRMINMADPQLLAAFVEGAVKAYPAQHHALITWNHGGGWALLNMDWNAPGARKRTSMQITDFRQGVVDGMRAAGLSKWDLIGMDMCLMSQLEVATELHDLGEVLVASEEVIPGKGMPYDRLLRSMGQGAPSARRIGAELVTAYNEFYKREKEEVTTLSAIDLSLVPEVNEKLNALCDKLMPAIDQKWASLARSLFYCEQYTRSRDEFKKGKGALQSIDLLDALKKCRASMPDFPAEREYAAFLQATQKLIIANATGQRRTLSNGLAVYAPVIEPAYNPVYERMRFSKASRWPQLVQAMYPVQARDKEAPVFGKIGLVDAKGSPITAVTPLNAESITVEVTGKNMVWVKEMGGKREPQLGGVRILGINYIVDPDFMTKLAKGRENFAHDVDLLMPQLKDGLNRLRQPVLGVILKLTDGRNGATVMMDASSLGTTTEFHVPVVIEDEEFEGGKREGTLTGSALTMQVEEITYEDQGADGSWVIKALNPKATTKFAPLFLLIKDDGSRELVPAAQIAWGKGLEFAIDVAEAGNYEEILVAETLAGASTTARLKVTVRADEKLTEIRQSWKGINPDRMIGTWEWYTTAAQPTPMGTTLTLAATKAQGVFDAKMTVTGPDGKKRELAGLMDLRLQFQPFYHMMLCPPDNNRAQGGLMGPIVWDPDGRVDRVRAMIVGPNKSVYWVKKSGGVVPRRNEQKTPEGWVRVADARQVVSVAVPPTFEVDKEAVARIRQVFGGYDIGAMDEGLGAGVEIVRIEGTDDPQKALAAIVVGAAQLGVRVRPGKLEREKLAGVECFSSIGSGSRRPGDTYVFTSHLIPTAQGFVAVNFQVTDRGGARAIDLIALMADTIQIQKKE